MPRLPSPLACRAALRDDWSRLCAALPFPDDHDHPTLLVRHELEQAESRIRGGPPPRLSTPYLRLMFQAYDARAFRGLLARALPEGSRGVPRLRISNRMTKAAGKTTCRRAAVSPLTMRRTTSIEIAISAPLLSVPVDPLRGVLVSGVRCFDQLDALQRVFEHEIVHTLLFCLGWESRCSGELFQTLAGNLFGHRSSKHELALAPAVVGSGPGATVRLRPGDRVRFEFRGTHHEGVVNRITKRATVLVEDPRGVQYTDGGRYLKFYVPLPHLERVA